MNPRFSSGKHSIAECDRCGFRYKLKQLRKLVIKAKETNIMVCPECWEMDHPQNMLGMYPVYDPQAVREPRPDISISGQNNSRDIYWGWNPVGGGRSDLSTVYNPLLAYGAVGTVTITNT